MPTLEDVARRAGVSTATVSKVLSNTPYFTEATRVKVMQAVDELGYVPHLAARALATGKTHIVAVVFPYVYDPIFADPLVLRVLEGIEIECRANGYNILLSTPRMTPDGPDSHYLQLISSGYMDGIIALDNVPFASVVQPVHKKNIPVVSAGQHGSPYTVRTDDFSGGRLQMEHALALGHRKIGFITTEPHIHFAAQLRADGWREAAKAADLSFNQFPLVNGDFSTTSGLWAAGKIIEQHPDLTALVCLNDRMAMGAIQQLRQMGRRIPDDIAVIGYDNIPMSAHNDPPLTTIDQRAPALGQALARMLFDVLDGKSPDPVLYPVDLIVRQSSVAWRKDRLTQRS